MSELARTVTHRQRNVYIEVFLDPHNKRVRVDHYTGDVEAVMAVAEQSAIETHAEKLIIKGLKQDLHLFLEKGYTLEAVIDCYFLGHDAYLFCKYFTSERGWNDHFLMEADLVRAAKQASQNAKSTPIDEYTLVQVTEHHVEELAALYKEVFQIYPTPLHDPGYIQKTMEEGTIYYGFTHAGTFISAASAEMNRTFMNAELTDCATLKSYRKFGLMKLLLEKLEAELVERQIFCSYSIARSLSFGMNAVLHQLGYLYRGRLINNCYIFDKLEDMNVWVKDLSKPVHAEK